MKSISVKKPLGFFDLPPEIRLQILEFTQLNPAVAPLIPAFGYLPVWKGHLGIPADWRKEDEFVCNICARHTSGNSYCLWKRFGYLKSHASIRNCWCRSVPFSLFIVSKRMKIEVEYVFFKFNGFEFYPSKALDVCQYLNGLEEYNFQLIRDLRFTFSSQQCEHWDDRGRNDWRLLLNWIRYSDYLKDLRLVIDVESHGIFPDCVWPLDENGFEDDPAYIDLYQMVCEIALEAVVIREKLSDLQLRLPYFRLLEKPLEQEILCNDHNSRQRSEPWKAMEQRSYCKPSASRLPPWHDIVWKEITNRYRELAYLLKASESQNRDQSVLGS